MAYEEYSKNKSRYTYTGRDGKEYVLDFKGGKDDYLSDNLFQPGSRKLTALGVKLFLELGRKPSKEEFIKARNQAYGTPDSKAELHDDHWLNVERDLDTFIKNNNLENYSEKIKPGYTEPQGLDSYDPKANYYDLITSGNSDDANEHRNAMYDSIDRQQTEVDKTLAAAELDAYRMLGNQQLQLERQIADQRMRSLRSGTTSAQLASMELQNMFSGQSAAAGIAGQVMQQRVDNAQQFAQQRGAVEPGLYDMINQNKTTLANVEAQRFAAQKGLEGYSTYHQAYGMGKLKEQFPDYYDTFNNMMKTQSGQ